jgi:hypothetical protein
MSSSCCRTIHRRARRQQRRGVADNVEVHPVLHDLRLEHRDDPHQRAGAGRVDDGDRPVRRAKLVVGGFKAVPPDVAQRRAPPVGERLVVAGVEAEVLEPGGCVSHDGGG